MREDESSDIVIYVNVNKGKIVESGEVLHLEYHILSRQGYIKEVQITTIHPEEGEEINYETQAHEQKITGTYNYIVPPVANENTEIKIYIKAKDSTGAESRYALKFNVFGAKLEELSAIELSNPLS